MKRIIVLLVVVLLTTMQMFGADFQVANYGESKSLVEQKLDSSGIKYIPVTDAIVVNTTLSNIKVQHIYMFEKDRFIYGGIYLQGGSADFNILYNALKSKYGEDIVNDGYYYLFKAEDNADVVLQREYKNQIGNIAILYYSVKFRIDRESKQENQSKEIGNQL